MVKFNFTYDLNVSLEQRIGFEMAAAIWASFLTDDVTINLHIGAVDTLGENGQAVGGAVPIFHEAHYGVYQEYLGQDATSAEDRLVLEALQEGNTVDLLVDTDGDPTTESELIDGNTEIMLTRAQAKALGMEDPLTLENGTTWDRDTLQDSDALDGYIQINNSYNWHYDFTREADAPEGTLDFLTMALHEIGHSLGFVSGIDGLIDTFNLYSGEQRTEGFTSLDLMRYSETSATVDNPDGSVSDLSFGGAAYFSIDGGATSLAEFEEGNEYQASHWQRFRNAIGIMDPTLGYQERTDISKLDLTAFDAIGWDIDYTALANGLDLNALYEQANTKVNGDIKAVVASLTGGQDWQTLGHEAWFKAFQNQILKQGWGTWFQGFENQILEQGWGTWFQDFQAQMLEQGWGTWFQDFETQLLEQGWGTWFQDFESHMLKQGWGSWFQAFEEQLLKQLWGTWFQNFEGELLNQLWGTWFQDFEAQVLEQGWGTWFQDFEAQVLEQGWGTWFQNFEGQMLAQNWGTWFQNFDSQSLHQNWGTWFQDFDSQVLEQGWGTWFQHFESKVLEQGWGTWFQNLESQLLEQGWGTWFQKVDAHLLKQGWGTWFQKFEKLALEQGWDTFWQDLDPFLDQVDSLYEEQNAASLQLLMEAFNAEPLSSDQATQSGGTEDDIIGGTKQADSIRGQAGDDLIDGAGGDDLLWGDAGRDIIYGFDGNDTIYGGDDDDLLLGERGDDKLYGNAGADIISGGQGHDLISGEAGRDDLRGDAGNDVMLGGTGDDRMDGGRGRDLLLGQSGRDSIKGGDGNDVIYGDHYMTVGQNLVVNGSFESITTNGSQRTNRLAGWTVGNGDKIETWRQTGAADDGHAWVELDLVKSTRNSIAQTIAVAANQTYLLSFAYSPKAGYDAKSNDIAVYWDGQLLDTIQLDGTTNTGNVWSTYNYKVQGNAAGTAQLEFRPPNWQGIDGVGGAIDDVQVRSLNRLAGSTVDAQALHSTSGRQDVLRIEAEAMTSDLHTDGTADWVVQSSTDASGGQVLVANPNIVFAADESSRGLGATATFTGDYGYYDIFVRYFDPSANQGIDSMSVTGMGFWDLNLDNDQFNTKVAEGVLLRSNERIRVWANKENGGKEDLQLDYIEFRRRYDLDLTNRFVESEYDLNSLDMDFFMVLDPDSADGNTTESTSTESTTKASTSSGELQPLPGASSDVLQGGRGDDVIYGGEGDDIIYGEDTTDNTDTLSAAFASLSSYKTYGGHFYYTTSSAMTWEAAQAEAERMGGNLVTINDEFERQWLNDNFYRGWIGLTDRDQEGTWQWVSGEANNTDYTRALESEVETTSGYTSAGDYASIYFYSGSSSSSVYSELSTATYYGIIEVKAPEYGGRDLLVGGVGNDQLFGNSGNDLLYGGDDDDLLVGGSGNDELFGGSGNDTLYGDAQTTENPDLPDGAYYNGSLYVLTDLGLTWTEAQAQAQTLGGNLVTINDQFEHKFLLGAFDRSVNVNGYNYPAHYWIGLTDQVQEGQWQWVSGEAVTYTKWRPGFPENYDGGTSTSDYAYLLNHSNEWLSTSNSISVSRRGIIEIKAPYAGNDLLTGGAGNDTLVGGLGADTLYGSDANAAGAFEQDQLMGGLGNDTFILGGASQAYYIANGDADYAVITDFTSGLDILQLHGSAADYTQTQVGSDVFLRYGASQDLIAKFSGISTLELATSAKFV